MNQIPTQVSESVRKRNPHLYGPSDYVIKSLKCGEAYAKEFCTPKPAKRIRQSSKPLLNKLEQEWFDVLLIRYPSHAKAIRPQTIRFKLGNGIWYKPDIWCPTLGTWGCCWEVKGPHSFRGGIENLKVAASLYPEIKWVLVWKDKGWQEQEVLP